MKPLYFWLAVCVISFLGACATPETHYPERYPGHAAFLENAHAGWSWK